MEHSLTAPTLLLAMPQVLDPFFHKSIVLLMAHDDDGSLGLVVNRPTDLTVHDVLEDLEMPWSGDPNALVWVGGPVRPQVGTVLFRDRSKAQEVPATASEETTGTEVLPGLKLTQQISELERLAQHPPDGLRLILGYAGWSEGQLLEEVMRNDWLTAPVDLDLVFNMSPAEAWECGLRSVGVDPATLPSWTAPSGPAN